MADAPETPAEELPYGVLASAELGGGDFYVPEVPDKVVKVAVLTLMFHPYDRLTAAPVGLRLVLDPTDVANLVTALTEQAEAMLSTAEEANTA